MTVTDPVQILASVNAALQAETRIDVDALSLELRVDDGGLVLNGSVDTIEEKRIAANVAGRAVPRECPVRDRLRVRSREAGRLEFRDELVRILSAESVFSKHTLTVAADGQAQTIHEGSAGAGRIDVQIDDGSVTLSGRVASLSHRRLAEVLVWWVASCELVENLLEVIPPERDDDNEITDVVRMVLEKDPLVHATQLRVGTAGGVVAIEGLVTSAEERRLAVTDAWYVPGVWDVVDRIEVRP